MHKHCFTFISQQQAKEKLSSIIEGFDFQQEILSENNRIDFIYFEDLTAFEVSLISYHPIDFSKISEFCSQSTKLTWAT